MTQGKQACRILKDIRRQIAEANDIEFITSECQYHGDCLGTCPKCEAEVRYLEQQLECKRIAGKVITVLGLSAGMVALSPLVSCSSSQNKGTPQEIISDTTINKNMLGESVSDTIKETKPAITLGDVRKEDRQLIEVTSHSGIIDDTDTERQRTITENDTLDMVESMPQFPGGQTELMRFIRENLKYPDGARARMIEGRVIVQFIINKEGDVVLPIIARGVNSSLDKEAIRVTKLMPKWKPGEMSNGKKVAVRFTIPVTFRLEKTDTQQKK